MPEASTHEQGTAPRAERYETAAVIAALQDDRRRLMAVAPGGREYMNEGGDEIGGEAFVGELGRGKTWFQPHRLTDFDSAPDSVTWVGPARGTVRMLPANEVLDYLGRKDATEPTPERLVRETEELAVWCARSGAGEHPDSRCQCRAVALQTFRCEGVFVREVAQHG